MLKSRLVPLALALAAACAAPPSKIDPSRPVRIAVRASESTKEISTLSYKGGFETKTLVYETLVKRDAEGRIAPCLAQSWRFEQDGRECVFELRVNARFHDGTPVTAEAVRQHFQRWVGLPEHDWLSCNRHILAVRAEGPRTLRIVMDEPRALLPDLCAINPCAVRGPATLDFEGNFVKPIGSGPFTWEGADEDGGVLHYALRQRPGKDGLAVSRIDLVRFVNEGPDVPIDQLLAGKLDMVADSWRERIPRERIAQLRANRRFEVVESAGSSVISVGFRTEGGPCADETLRKAIRNALDRKTLIERAELGYADPCFALAAPSERVWPISDRTVTPQPPPAKRRGAPLRLLARSDSDYQPALAKAIAEQLFRANMPTDVVLLHGEALSQALESGAFDLRIESTWGSPYDPDISLNFRFGPPLDHPSSDNPPVWGQDARITELVVESQREWDETRRAAIYAKIQERIDQIAILIPLYTPRRFAVLRADLPPPQLDPDLYRIDAASVAPATIVRQP
jgi:ABC-type transport system substrate-binding protein